MFHLTLTFTRQVLSSNSINSVLTVLILVVKNIKPQAPPGTCFLRFKYFILVIQASEDAHTFELV